MVISHSIFPAWQPVSSSNSLAAASIVGSSGPFRPPAGISRVYLSNAFRYCLTISSFPSSVTGTTAAAPWCLIKSHFTIFPLGTCTVSL